MKSKPQQFPTLVWSDKTEAIDILLMDSKNKHRILSNPDGVSITMLIEEISKIIGVANLVNEAENADEHFFSFAISEFSDDIISWNKLLSDFKKELGYFKPHSISDPKLLLELKKNYQLDLAASALNSAYNSAIYYLAKLCNELAVNSIGVSGNLAKNDRFLKLLHSNLGEHYQIIVLL